MRLEFPEIVEKGRNLRGPLSSKPGDRHGSFFIRCRATGELLKIVASDGADWADCYPADSEQWEHVSVSCELRCPNWQEMCFVKELFFGDDECVMQLHPPKKDYVNCHPNVLHLWRPTTTPIPRPPQAAV